MKAVISKEKFIFAVYKETDSTTQFDRPISKFQDEISEFCSKSSFYYPHATVK